MKKIIYISAALIVSSAALAQDDLVQNKAPEAAVKESGWHPSLKLGASFSQQTNDSVIGQQDGDTISLGINIDSGMDYKRDQHEWRQSLAIKEATSKSPSVPRYAKSGDDLTYKSTYLYSLASNPKIAPYFRLSAQTQIFKGEDVRGVDTTYVDAANTTLRVGQNYKLTDPFRPMTTRESVGINYKFIEKKDMTLEARLGYGALQVLADDQLAIDEYSADTNTVKLKQLASYEQAGAELGAELKGNIDEKTSYAVNVELFQPMSPDLEDGDDRSDSELLDSLVSAKLTSKMYEWMSLSLEGKYQRQPQLQVEEQKSISLLLNFTHSVL